MQEQFGYTNAQGKGVGRTSNEASIVALSTNPPTQTLQATRYPHSEAIHALRDHAEDGETYPQSALSMPGQINVQSDLHSHLRSLL